MERLISIHTLEAILTGHGTREDIFNACELAQFVFDNREIDTYNKLTVELGVNYLGKLADHIKQLHPQLDVNYNASVELSRSAWIASIMNQYGSEVLPICPVGHTLGEKTLGEGLNNI